MEQVIGELIGNAIKYTPEGGIVSVTIQHRMRKTLTQTVNLIVQDSGIGMTKDECAKIWERFYRTNTSRRFARGGGLGLSIAEVFIELHGRTIQVESEPNRGTRFIVTLPYQSDSRSLWCLM